MRRAYIMRRKRITSVSYTHLDVYKRQTQEINADGVTNSQIFINKFEASTTYGDEGGLNVTKTLNGRTLAEMCIRDRSGPKARSKDVVDG